MEEVSEAAQAVATNFWTNAVGPLHRLTWETGALFFLMVLAVGLVVTAMARLSWRFSKATLSGKKVKGVHHTFADNLRVSANEYLKFNGRDPAIGIRSEIARRDIAVDANRFHVVTVVERAKKRAVLYRELRLQPGQGKGTLTDEYIQLDQINLTELRLNNGYDDDDEPGLNISGDYDVYIRPVRWFDVRHWLAHPNREVRIVVWVTLITTLLPVLLDLLFG